MDHTESAVAARAVRKVEARLRQDKTGRKAKPAQSKARDDLRIGSLLVRGGLMNPNQIKVVLARSNKERVPFGQAAVSCGLITPSELEQALGMQFRHQLARPGESRISERVVTAFRNDHEIVEQMRALRSQLMLQWLSAPEKHNRTLAVLSPNERDGKSMLIANLATSFAQAGLRTLLIDGDLRKPSQHRLFGLSNRAGLSTILCGREKESYVYRLHDIPGLSIMTAGGMAPNPTELLAPRRLKALFDTCARKYQVVLVDTAATCVGPDAGLIASQASGYVSLCRAGKTEFESLRQSTEDMAQLGANLLGSVMVER